MIQRRVGQAVVQALRRQAAVALLGPRQVGKTTLSLEIAERHTSEYLDLESRTDRQKLSDPALFLRRLEDRLVILDEIHRMPEVFRDLRSLIDAGRRRGRRTGRFLILGSASMALLKQSSESLAGRIEYVNLNPFDVLEVAPDESSLGLLWTRGGFPDSFLSKSDDDSASFRRNLVRTYIEREIPQMGGRVSAETAENLWIMLCHSQGALSNAAKLAAGLSVSAPTVTSYLSLLADLFVVRRLRPYFVNVKKRLVKSPKIYVRDSGLVHSLLGIEGFRALHGHPVVGASWEGFVIENLLSVARPGTGAYFYRTSAGAEMDLVLEIPGRAGVWAIEVKRGLSVSLSRGFHSALEDLRPEKTFVVYSGEARYPISREIEVIGLRQMAELLQST